MSGVTLTSGTTTSGTTVNTGAVELTDSGGRALKLQTDAPHLVSMGGGRLSTAVTLHPLPQGRVTLGSSPAADIKVQGTGVLPMHCHIENCDGIVTIYPLSENLCIDSVPVTGATRLSQGAMLTIGRSNYMRFNHPAEAKLIKAALPNSRISMTPMSFEVESGYQSPKYGKKPPVVPRKISTSRDSLSDDEKPSSIMTKVTKFEYLAAQNLKKSISPKVFSSNLVTVNMPAKDVLGKTPPDLQTFAKNLPQSALNYSELNHTEKQKIKTPDRQIFGRKSPNYVNVTLNETKTINNRVVIYENGCVPKHQKVGNDGANDLNIINNRNCGTTTTQNLNKTVNVSRTTTSSPCFNNTSCNGNSININQQQCCDPADMYKCVPAVCGVSGHLEDVALRKNEAELRRNQAQVDRIKEQEVEKAEQVRLEEILNMCAEYEKQVQCEKQAKPITPNRIKTNGSLPRDKRQCISPNLLKNSPQHTNDHIFRFETEHIFKQNNSYENVIAQGTNSNVSLSDLNDSPVSPCGSMYENITLPQNNSPFHHSPRTRIKTFITNKEPIKDNKLPMIDVIESKFAAVQLEHNNFTKSLNSPNKDDDSQKPTPTKLILPIELNNSMKRDEYEYYTETFKRLNEDSLQSSLNSLTSTKSKQEVNKKRIDELKGQKKEHLAGIAKIKRQMAEIEILGEELHRELQMEKALINGEFKSKEVELEKLQSKKEKLQKRAHKIDEKMKDCQAKQEEDQKVCKQKLQMAQENMHKIETLMTNVAKGTKEYEDLFEDYLAAQEILDNERKTFEDLEFHHLEEEADWLASREELQREIVDLSQKIDEINSQIIDLDYQQSVTSSTNAEEYRKIEQQKIEFSKKIEEVRNKMKIIDNELSKYSNQESEQEASSDTDSDKEKHLNKPEYCIPPDLSTSLMMDPNDTHSIDDIYNMSQSFNEKMLHEKLILDGDIVRKYPSQDDIDRISKVTSNSPMNIDDGRGSLGRKTIESLKEIERKRKLHLVQQGCQVIENERMRVLALKQRVQQEVRVKWAQRSQDCSSLNSTGSDETQYSVAAYEQRSSRDGNSNGINQSDLEPLRGKPEGIESPRPLSETSDVSVEVGALTKKRNRPDKHRPLTRYLPIRSAELDLKVHIESAGHQVVLCPHVTINTWSCRGFLHKKGSKLNGWSRRWFVFDRNKRTLVYYSDKSEKKARGGAYFQAIEEVYLDHSNSIKSPNPQLTFIVKTHERCYYLMAPSPEAMRIWIDVIFTGAEGYQEFEHGT
nr:pleckstrin homology-like domain family B member 1 [Onthophagus taurus]